MEGSGGGAEAASKKKKSSKEGEEESLPPGFRFHPTDEELITYYLRGKIADAGFTARAITEVDLNKCEPWDLPEKAKMGEKEWYFFSLRDRKYRSRKDKEIFTGQPSSTQELVGMKKTLVFYKGRAPRGEKSNWVMHEYRLHLKPASKSNKDEWVVCRIFAKSPGVKKYPSSTSRSHHHHHPYTLDMVPQFLPTLLGHGDLFGGRGHHHPYMAPADLAELSRVARGTPGLHPHLQPHPPPSPAPATSTLRALQPQLNLGARRRSTPSSTPCRCRWGPAAGGRRRWPGDDHGAAYGCGLAGCVGIAAAGGDGGFGGRACRGRGRWRQVPNLM
ncbi:hypothetical protein ZWY2020_059568 [Hordeum vulgare]|nr:hypothetical protein ZWY2020_059568 [Hordeum vulgare]